MGWEKQSGFIFDTSVIVVVVVVIPSYFSKTDMVLPSCCHCKIHVIIVASGTFAVPFPPSESSIVQMQFLGTLTSQSCDVTVSSVKPFPHVPTPNLFKFGPIKIKHCVDGDGSKFVLNGFGTQLARIGTDLANCH